MEKKTENEIKNGRTFLCKNSVHKSAEGSKQVQSFCDLNSSNSRRSLDLVNQRADAFQCVPTYRRIPMSVRIRHGVLCYEGSTFGF
jgi:hypothetical protein